MRTIHWVLFSVFLMNMGCSQVPSVSQAKTITIANAAAVDAELLEQLRQFAEDQLHVPVRAVEMPRLAGHKSFQALEKAALRLKMDADVTLIVLSGLSAETEHLKVYSEDGVALVNTTPLSIEDPNVFARRVERQVMRAAAFSFGLPPTPDPFCVTRNYNSLKDLDRMGRNYSPPWQGRYAEEAAKRGLRPVVPDRSSFPSTP